MKTMSKSEIDDLCDYMRSLHAESYIQLSTCRDSYKIEKLKARANLLENLLLKVTELRQQNELARQA